VQMDSTGKLFVRYEDLNEGKIKNMPL